MTARVLLSFLATAGFFYVNIMPALVDGLKRGLGFSNQQAGLVGSLNVYGAACGTFLIAFLIQRIRWRPVAHLLLFGLIAMDSLSMFIHNPDGLMATRFAQGFIGGMLIGLSFFIMAQTKSPDRTFGMLLLVQMFCGGVGVMCLPLLVPRYGTDVLFGTLILFSTITLAMLQFIPDYAMPEAVPREASASAEGILWKPLLLALVSVFLYQVANMGLFAFIIGLGKAHGLSTAFTSDTLGIANWCSILGAVLVIALSTRFGILRPLTMAMLLTAAGTYVFNFSEVKWVWIAANIGTGIAWNFVISHLLGMCARFDRTGRASVWSGFVSHMGLASGPFVASFIVGANNYSALIMLAVLLLVGSMLASLLPAWLLDHGAVDQVPGMQSTECLP